MHATTDMVAQSGWTERLASPKWTVGFFLLAAVGALLVGRAGQPATLGMAAPFAILAVNLVAALACQPRLRADLPLLTLHLALLVLVLLFVLARLSYLVGQAPVTAGTAFDGRIDKLEHGPLSAGRVEGLVFFNEGVRALYDANGKHRGSYNRVRWQTADGGWRSAEIGDDRPLVIGQYRVFATRHRGLAPLFRWEANGRPAEHGTVQLADHRAADYPPSVSWRLPHGPQLWLLIEHAPVGMPAGRVEENLDAALLDHTLVIRTGESRHILRLGESLDLPEGRLTYVSLSNWIGYRIVHDPVTPWLMAAILVAVASLCWFYARRFRSTEVSACV